MAVKKKKKMVDLIDLYLNQFIGKIAPKEFRKILDDEHEALKVKNSLGFMILKFKENADVDYKLYDFYKSKDGIRIECIGKYYYRSDSPEDLNIKNLSHKCFLCQQKLLNLSSRATNSILDCKWCHRTAFDLYQQSVLKLKSQKGAENLDGNEE